MSRRRSNYFDKSTIRYWNGYPISDNTIMPTKENIKAGHGIDLFLMLFPLFDIVHSMNYGFKFPSRRRRSFP